MPEDVKKEAMKESRRLSRIVSHGRRLLAHGATTFEWLAILALGQELGIEGRHSTWPSRFWTRTTTN